jgi:C4-dicarboxylate transporter DctM subunit
MFIIACASIFSWVAAIEDIPARLGGELLSISDNPVILLLLINLILLIAGTFVETTAALILLVPMILSLLPSLGIDLVQLGLIVVTNLAIGMLTPPMGICLIVSGTISGSSIGAISRRIVPFLLILLVDLLIITFWAPLTMWLPGLLIG